MNDYELGKKATSGLLWSFIDRFSLNISALILGIILARLLSPEDFGLVAIVYVFIAVSRIFIDGGFSQSLIRDTNATQADYSTMFFFNILIGFFSCIVLYHSASHISIFFNKPILNDIVKVLSLMLIIDSISIVSQTKLAKEINFKLQTKITVFSTVTSGILGIYLAYTGFEVWSLVYMQISQRILNSILLLSLGRWLPNFVFSIISLKQMFSYGWKLALSNLINVFHKNTHLFVIGKYFSVTDLGFYSRADKFAKLPSENIAGVFGRVSFPTLSLYQDDKPLLLENFKIFLKVSMFLNVTSLLFLAAISDNLIIVLIGEKWQGTILLLQLLCLVLVLYPMQTLNLVLLKVEGKTDVLLNLECLKAILIIPSIFICIIYGINFFILALFFSSLISFFINSSYSRDFIGYGSLNQLKDVLPILIAPIFLSVTIFFLGHILNNIYTYSNFEILLLQFFIGILMFFLMNEKFNSNEYVYLKSLIKGNL